ncbi:Thymocyte nuclear protein 1 [Penicillium chermesinum]|uniref:Thymocyte nuclear protein 1 n=1 Tax=Penicillium chermesinum TaxID=63820 RepID=A0A9W9TJM6_9EURO|nr:Thymocyte nuclear protein 1 [Penicillium chermesinum]KAJ5225287.1 Thymocyte nuclear protein 1 [Penicillium chermesinum]
MSETSDPTPKDGDASANKEEGASELATPKTGDKRKRGRPRKDPADVTPKSDGPKRARGRPRKVVSEADAAEAAKKAAASSGEKKGRGRPRKEPGTTLSLSLSIDAFRPISKTLSFSFSAPRHPSPNQLLLLRKKDGRGRPRKSLPSNGNTPASSKTTPPKKKDGRGRPRKSLPANGDDPLVEEQTEVPAFTVPKEDTGRSYWLMKAEPESRMEKGVDVKFSIDDLAAAKEPEPWDGVRNPVARNLMREMRKGDLAFFYHSNCKSPGIVGAMEIVKEHSADESAFDPKHPYYDPKSNADNPKWVVVHVEFRRKFNKPVTLTELKDHAEAGKPLENLQTLKQSRLSVSSVTPAQWRYILEVAGEEPFPAPTKDESSSE